MHFRSLFISETDDGKKESVAVYLTKEIEMKTGRGPLEIENTSGADVKSSQEELDAGRLSKQLVLSLILLILALSSGGCGVFIIPAVNEQLWTKPPAPEKQHAAVLTALQGLTQISSPDAYISLEGNALNEHVAPILKTAVPEIRSANIRTDKQAVILDIGFSGRFGPGETITAVGTAQVHAFVSAEGRELVIRPYFARIKLKRIWYLRWKVPGSVIAVLNSALPSLLARVNSALEGKTVVLPDSFSAGLTPEGLGEALDNVEATWGSPFQTKTGLVAVALLIDTEGIHAVADFEHVRPLDFLSIAGAINGSQAAASGHEVQKRAFLSLCREFHRLDDSPSGKVLKIACAAGEGNSLASAPPPPTDSFDADYARLTTDFKALAGKLNVPADLDWNDTGAVVAKQFIAAGINLYSTDAHFGARFKLPTERLRFNTLLKTEKAPELNCGNNQPNCYDNSDCTPNWPCGTRGCPSDCGLDPSCWKWKYECEVLKESERIGCEADKVRYRAQCDLQKVIRNAACEVERAAWLAGCQLNQEWLYVWDEYEIGRIEGNVALGESRVTLELGGVPGMPMISVAEDLSRIEVNGTTAATSEITADLLYTPLNLGHILCFSQWNARVSAGLEAPTASFSLAANIQPDHERVVVDPDRKYRSLFLRTTVGGGLTRTFSLRGRLPGVGTWIPPVPALLAQNPTVGVVCAPAVALGVTAHIAGNIYEAFTGNESPVNLLKDSFTITTKSVGIVAEIPPVALDLGLEKVGNEMRMHKIVLQPRWGGTTIFYRRPKDVDRVALEYEKGKSN